MASHNRQHSSSHRLFLVALALCQADFGHAFQVPSSSSSLSIGSFRSRHLPQQQQQPSCQLVTTSQRQRLVQPCNNSDRNNNKKDYTINYLFNKDNEGELQVEVPDPSSSFKKYGRPQDINESSFGALLPIAEAVDEATGGWGLSYADLHPATPRTTVGQAFLATNFFYAAAGLWLGFKGDWFYGGLTELAGIVSFTYHYVQLDFGKNRSEVRLALLIDYFCAGSALITGGVYMVLGGITTVPIDAIVAGGGAVLCLSLCWVWEFGYPYIFWHSLWHILSAYTGFLVGQDHLSKLS